MLIFWGNVVVGSADLIVEGLYFGLKLDDGLGFVEVFLQDGFLLPDQIIDELFVSLGLHFLLEK